MASLKTNTTLLNPNFEGYKLATTELKRCCVSLESKVNISDLKDGEYSYAHLCAQSLQNHLTLDLYNVEEENKTTLYYVDQELQVVGVEFEDGHTACGPIIVFQIPHQNETLKHVSPCIEFPSEKMAVISDGYGRIFVIETSQRSTSSNKLWKCQSHTIVYDSNCPNYILNVMRDDKKPVLHCLLMILNDDDGKTTVQLDWLQISTCGGYNVETVQKLKGSDVPLYTSFSNNLEKLIIASRKVFNIETAKVNEVHDKDEATVQEINPTYWWYQSNEYVSVNFNIPMGVTKDDIHCTIGVDHLKIGRKEQEPLLEGQLEMSIDPDGSKWLIDGKRLEVFLLKKEHGKFWSSVVVGDNRGRHFVEGEEEEKIRQVHESLKHLTSDKVIDNDDEQPLASSMQLEECDATQDDDPRIVEIDAWTGKKSNETSVAGHQWLFNTQLKGNDTSLFCIRHDVDGLLWRPICNGESPWHHEATFHALGYVQASKTEHKFTVCSRDLSFVAITDCERHVFIYLQHKGRQAEEKQYVITLDANQPILGCQASKESLFILTEDKLHCIKVISTD